MLIDKDGVILTSDHTPVDRNKNILDVLVSDFDRKAMQDAMGKATMSIPQVIHATFYNQRKPADYLCHIYKGKLGYFISCWQYPNKVVRLNNYINLTAEPQ